MTRPAPNHRLYSTLPAVLPRVAVAWVCLLFCFGKTSTASPVGASSPDVQQRVATAAPRLVADTTAAWTLYLDGEPSPWPGDSPVAEIARAPDVAAATLRSLRRDGFYAARLDSVVVDTSASPPEARVYVRSGARVVLGTVRITGADSLRADRIRSALALRTGRPLAASDVRAGTDAVLSLYEDEGFPLAQIRIDSLWIDRDATPPELGLHMNVDEGPALWLERVVLPPGSRTSPRFVARIAGLRLGGPLRRYDPARIRTALEQTGLFSSVGAPELRTGDDGGTTLFVPLQDVAPGTFDVVLGYLPGSDGGGEIVGNGRLALRNLLGSGRRLNLALDRRPGQASLLHVRAVDPFVAGRPIRAEAAFTGEQRDSTFSERQYRLAVGLQPSPAWSLSVTGTREVTRPGQGGALIVRGEQQIPRASAFFYGLSAHAERLDDRRNPRRGVRAEAVVEQGRKRRSLRRVVDQDTLRQRETLRQERITGSVRVFLPTFERQTVALGADAHMLRSDAYDASDLFRIGGAESLRGYDEDRYLGRIALRGLAEYRVQLDRVSYAFAFADLGYVDTPETAELDARRRVLPGYGVGLQFGTPLGIASLSYALQPGDSPARGRIHLGVSLGL